jgi:hypothetical protein
MKTFTKQTGSQMGAGMSRGFKAGLGSMRKQIGGMAGSLKGHLKTALTFGGTLGLGALLKEAVEAQSAYRDIEFSLSKIPEAMMSWQDIQTMINKSADDTGQRAEVLRDAFHDMFRSTGASKYAADAIGDVGLAATASGEGVDNLANAAQLMQRKFDIGSNDLKSGLVSFLQLTGSGGKSIDELTGRFAVMAGEAASAGMRGVPGLQQLLGLLINLDSTIGEKADPGLKAMFQTLKSGSAQLKGIQKMSGMKFSADMSGLDKIKKMLTTKRGRAAAEFGFKADARQVFDELAKPFDEAFKNAKAKGEKRADAVQAGLKAFDDALAESSTVTMTWKDIQKKASDRLKDDPAVQLRRSIDKVVMKFSDPKMIGAIDRLTDKLPMMAEKVADFIDWVSKNPWKAVAAGVGIKLGAGFASGMAASIAKQIAGAIGGTGAAGAAGAAGASGAGAAGAAGAGAAGAGLLAVGGAITAGAAVGVGTGLALNHFVFDPHSQSYADKLRSARGMGSLLTEASQNGSTAEHKLRLIEEVKAAKTALGTGRYTTENMMGELAAVFTDVKAPSDDIKEVMSNLNKTQIALMTMLQEQLKEGKQATKNTTEFSDALRAAGTGLRQFVPNGASGRGLNSLPNKPGADPVSG